MFERHAVTPLSRLTRLTHYCVGKLGRAAGRAPDAGADAGALAAGTPTAGQLQLPPAVLGRVSIGSWTGEGERGPKLAQLPRQCLAVSNVPVNPQNPTWADRFEVEVTGSTVKVWRVDAGMLNHGWAQELVLEFSAGGPVKPVPP